MAAVLAPTRGDDVLDHFRGRSHTPYEALADLTTAAVFHEPALATHRSLAAPDSTAYAYSFARVSPGNQRSGMLAHHMAELPYLFGPITPGDEYDPTYATISDAIQHAWTEFARTGTPRTPAGTPWPPCQHTDHATEGRRPAELP
ncbi:carboxylesterase family protein [Streptomyces sp. NPDC088348]|uniref:carboxylesterase family protein n=1 Tax=Streptomyces sp. NPDC088348 TaxID=3365853 RepID=UPI00381E77B2